MREMRASRLMGLALTLGLSVVAHRARAGAPPPSAPHPRLFMSDAHVAAYAKNVGTKGTAAERLRFLCDDTLSAPKDYATRGGSDGESWPGSAIRCAFAYKVTGEQRYLTQALKYWHAALDDDQTIGDGEGCVVGVNTDWSAYDGTGLGPPVIVTVTHDTGYPIRWYGPYLALTYDWLYGAPGVDESLRKQTRTCLTSWVDYYSKLGYLRDEPGGNYNAGFVLAKVLAAAAIGADGGADGHLWTEAQSLMTDLVVGVGLAGSAGPIGSPAGALVGGDWAEGWQYGSLSVLELATATRVLKENGVPLPAMDAWADHLATRLPYATVPRLDGSWVGADFDDDEHVYFPPNVYVPDAVLVAPSSDAAASWMTYLKERQAHPAGEYFYDALAEIRLVPPQDFRAQTPAPPLWYVARGTRAMYVRTGWGEDAYWGVFASAPHVVSDHWHFAASTFVLSRGGDHLVVDSARYGEHATFESNAVSAESTKTPPDYTGTQGPDSEAELVWARGTADAVYAARSDLSKAFQFGADNDVPYAHREWVMLPEGEVVTIDRVHTAGAEQHMFVQFHTNTGAGGLELSGAVAKGTVGGSEVAIHAVSLSSGTPEITQPDVTECTASCAFPCGQCDNARIPVDKYVVRVPGPHAAAVHVIDALAAGEPEAVVGTMNDDVTDPAPKANAGVIGAAVSRANVQTYVVASSGVDGAVGAVMTYGVPAKGASRHVVFDAPESASGKSSVTAAPKGDRCELTLGAGEDLAGHPLMFTLSPASEGCKIAAATDVVPGTPPGAGGGAGGPARGASDGGCDCTAAPGAPRPLLAIGAAFALATALRRRRARAR
jgi:hypothetical protein